jgi:CRISPR type III-A/MTUBE-associated protein Csm6
MDSHIHCILFSPLGNTDPITGYYDGACLHILRHYMPDCVALFYTKEIKEKEDNVKHGQWYQTAIKKLGHLLHHDFPVCKIYDSHIGNAHILDEFIRILPEALHDLHHTYPEAQILLNLSSGTPQIKTILSMMALDYDWCTGIQVAAPVNPTTGVVTHEKHVENNSDYDIDTLFELDADNEPNAVNRCSEPPLRTIRFFREKGQILSLLEQYDYQGAYALCQHNQNITPIVNSLLYHAVCRQRLDLISAKKILSAYDGHSLLPFDNEKQKLCDYILIMQINQHRHELADLLVKIVPFLYELLRYYVMVHCTVNIKRYCNIKCDGWNLLREKLERDPAGKTILAYLDASLFHGFKDSKLSYYLLEKICQCMKKNAYADDEKLNDLIIEKIEQLKGINNLRNTAAHQVIDISEDKFQALLGMGSAELVDCLFQLLCLVYGNDCRVMRTFYGRLNAWVEAELNKGCAIHSC